MNKKMSVIIIDDHQIVIKGIKLLLSTDKNIEIIGTTTSGVKGLDLCKQLTPNVLLTDISMPEMNGIELVREIKKLKIATKVVILSMHLEESFIVEALEAGAKGYLSKEANENEILESIHTVGLGHTYLSSNVAALLAESFVKNKKKEKIKKPLTKREQEILVFIVEGLSNKMISAQLNVSERTISVHRYNLMKKLDTPNAASLVRKAIELNLV